MLVVVAVMAWLFLMVMMIVIIIMLVWVGAMVVTITFGLIHVWTVGQYVQAGFLFNTHKFAWIGPKEFHICWECFEHIDLHENVSVSMFCSHGEQHCVDGYLILDHQVPASMLSPLALFVMELKGLFQIWLLMTDITVSFLRHNPW